MIDIIASLVNLNPELLEQLRIDFGIDINICSDLKKSADLLQKAEIVIGYVRADILKLCPNLKWYFILSAGVNGLPFKELKEKKVFVSNVSGIHGTQVAEQVFGMMIAFSRGIGRSIRNQLQKKWDKGNPVDELWGKKLCVIGAGSIGIETARKAKAFDMHTIGIKLHPMPTEYFDEVWGMDKLHDALGQSDYVVLTVPLTQGTYMMIGKAEFDAMKPSGIFINISRGDTVDEQAMIDALSGKQIKGAGLDVFHEEPLPVQSPLWDMENLIITSHNAGHSPHYMDRAMDIFRESYECYIQGKPLPNLINLELQY